MLTKNKNKNSVEESINPDNGLIFFGEGVEKTRQLSVKKAELTVAEPELTVNDDDDDRITLEGDIDMEEVLHQLKQSLNQLIDLKDKVIPFFKELPQVEEVIKPKTNYEKILDAGDHLCNLPPDADHLDIFRALTLFVWWDRLRNLNNLDLTDIDNDSIAEVLQAIWQTFPITKEDRKMVKTRTTKEYHYSLYLKVQPFLIRWYSVANADPSKTFVPYDHNLYEHIVKFEEFYCNLGELAPINAYFRAYWLFMWFEKRASIPIPNLSLGDIPKDKILKYLDTKFSVKNLKVPSKKEAKQEYFYQLYLQVKPYLVHYFALEKFEQKELFTYEI